MKGDWSHRKLFLACFIIAGVGGITPAICRLGATLVANPSTPWPVAQFYAGIAIFFLLGAVVGVTMAERKLRDSFIAGVCAPAIIQSLIGGVDEGKMSSAAISPSTKVETAYPDHLVTTAWLQPAAVEWFSEARMLLVSQRDVATFIHVRPVGLTGRDSAIDRMKVDLVDTNNERYSVELDPGVPGSYRVMTRAPIVSLQLKSRSVESTYSVPHGEVSDHLSLDLFVQFEVQKDFWYALGGSGKALVSGVQVRPQGM